MRIEAVEDASVSVWEDVAVEVERDSDRRVPHLRLEVLRMGASGDHQRGVRCGAGRGSGDPSASFAGQRAEDAASKVLVVQECAAR